MENVESKIMYIWIGKRRK